MDEVLRSLIANSCQSQVDLYSTLVSGLQVNRDVMRMILAIGGTPPVDPGTMDRLISAAITQRDEAIAVKSAMGGN